MYNKKNPLKSLIKCKSGTEAFTGKSNVTPMVTCLSAAALCYNFATLPLLFDT